MNKYLICRPMGGLNDVLCQIKKCLDYAIKHNRTVIVDTSKNDRIAGDLSDYFESLHSSLIFSANFEIPGDTCFPNLTDRNSYTAEFSEEQGCYISKEDQVALTFDFSKSFPEKFLLHQQPGGGLRSAKLLSSLQLNEKTEDAVRDNIDNVLQSKFDAIHIRNTDYLSDYEKTLAAFLKKGSNVFVATDSIEVKNFVIKFREMNHDLKFIEVKVKQDSSSEFINVLSDFCALIRANKFKVVPLLGGLPKYSGFTRLAKFGWLVVKVQSLNWQAFFSISGIAGQNFAPVRLLLNYLVYLPQAKLISRKKMGLLWQISNW